MLAAYSTRRSSVVLNPRGRVLGGMGEEGGGGDAPSGGDGGYGYDSGGDSQSYGGFALDRAEAESAALAAAEAAQEAADAAREASYSGSPTAAQAQAEALAAAEDAAMAAQEAARFANAAASAKAASAAAQAALASATVTASRVFQTVASKLGPIGFVASMIESVTGFVGSLVAGLGSKSGYNNAQQAIDNAHNQAGSDPQLHAEINKVQQSLNSVVYAGTEAAIKQLYATYAKRQPSAAELQYWTAQFGTSVTPDEVLRFTDVLYANEPNLRPTTGKKIMNNEQVFADAAKQIYADQSTTLLQKQKAISDVFRSTGVSVDYAANVFQIPREEVMAVIARNPPSAVGLPLMAALAAAAYFFIGS